MEDGAWNPRYRSGGDFYFLTTASFTSNCRLWRLRFDDIRNPQAGGRIDLQLEGDEGHKMADNMTIDGSGRILLQEDVGNNARLGKVWLYDTASGNLIEIAAHNDTYFASGSPDLLTADEESSGIIDASGILGPGWFLLDVQAHYSIPGELVEGGQLLALYVRPGSGSSPAGRICVLARPTSHHQTR